MTEPIVALRRICLTYETSETLLSRLWRKVRSLPPPPGVQAVNDVSLEIAEGEVLALVGESGCGKSSLGRIVAGLALPSAGEIAHGPAASGLGTQMVFQDPSAALNPRHTIGKAVTEAPFVHGRISRQERTAFAAQMLEKVGLDPALADRYPHQLSGGQRQRAVVARALAIDPALIVADEAVASLDVSVQAQILNLFASLRREMGLTFLFVSHDLSVVEHVSDRIAIMYLGKIVELGRTADIFAAPNHPYTQALLAAVPRVGQGRRRFAAPEGDLPSPLAPPPGCHFHPRCPRALPRCRTEVPTLRDIGGGRMAACHLNDEDTQ